VDPLVHGIVPSVESQFAGEDLPGEAGGSRGAGFGVAVLVFDDEITEFLFPPDNRAVL